MKFFKEFKDFAVKGNMMDMAIGIIIGASFNKLLDVLVKDVMMPPLVFISSGVSIDEKRFILRGASEGVTEISIQYGSLISAFIDFLVIGLTLFIVVKVMNRIKDKADDVKNLAFKTPMNIQKLDNIEKLLQEQNRLMKEKQK